MLYRREQSSIGVFSEKSLELPSSLFLFFPSLAPQIRIQFKFSIHSSAYGTLVFRKASSKYHPFSSIVSSLHRTILPINNSFERLKEKALYPVYFYGAVSSVLLRILKKSMQRKEIYPESACFDIYLVFKYSPTNSNMEKGQK